MTIITAVKSGNWSDPTVWDSGAVPQLEDTARPARWAVTIDQNVDLGAGDISCVGQTGYFQVLSDGIVVRCARVLAGAVLGAGAIRFNSAGNTLTIYADLYGGAGANASYAVRAYASGTLNIFGSCYGNTSPYSGGLGFSTVAGVVAHVVGDVFGGDGANSCGIDFVPSGGAAGCILEVTGDVQAGNAARSKGIRQYGGKLTVNGDVYGRDYDEARGIETLASGVTVPDTSVTINGSLYGASLGEAVYVRGRDHRVTLRITGNVVAYDSVYPDTLVGGGGMCSALLCHGRVVAIVSGSIIDGAHGTPAVAGTMFRDIAYPQSHIDLPYIDPATDVITLQRLSRTPKIGSALGRTRM
jgi:hypothetical protein